MNQNQLLTSRQIIMLYIGFSIVYISGLFIPLMENDSAQHASMAMRMALNNDFLHIFKGENPYLDKPHMHFWLAALSMKIFGINHIAYRIPALLCLALGVFSTKKLAEILYDNKNTGYLASLIFLSAQTIILSAHDVRTDAVLTGFIIFSIWQFVRFIKTQNIFSAVLAGLGTALAFSSKGLMAIVIIGFCIFAYLLYSREWKKFFNFKIVIAALSFATGIVPVLYAYHVQFGEEGIRFILFNQSVNRLTASGFEETSPDYLFFFHTLLWAFLPFSLAFYFGVFEKTAFFIKTRFRKTEGYEFLTLGGFWLVMLVFSASKFKLPHYLNGLIAVLSVLTAAYLFEMYRKNSIKKIKILYGIQLFVIFAVLIGIVLLTVYFTGIPHIIMYLVAAAVYGCLIKVIFSKTDYFRKYVSASLIFAIAVNIYLNTQFYPVLTQYQGSLKLAQFVNKNHIKKDRIFMLKGYEPWAFDFYTKRNTPRVDAGTLKKGDYLVVYDEHLNQVGRKYKVVDQENHYRITRLSLKFLNPKTREQQYEKMSLLEIAE
ncbi:MULTISPECIES: ArnT family glycosyltransferase [Chryseobacterium]|uniref:4-amino-4-deoxy-L-arabinose transferase-like glycosyltransferase n=1 Tax=Chryseobacterium camelliae TaxID=1265445 RepID=A0ABU0TJX2_9FLAO|nr:MULTISPECIES: glycosyltransferase family 39 protein [Chryseobacterium]MDT3408791.1 4-amino-4-deoxy-L-arabinose transferase-like glycosyltransferase [Pseudacidovorax intermedius]MDQ1097354.1 4-amino-4-deoxy-L-arabinose transferase-like glycosyltransferase [Chryseobacterium camelliae]MDQ1101285.1 4-amino-4-deoxy-L-arabinose transferase-like glycosyltransferase [Chryseobacterium sp. SORGH_AS_1048]MDR6084730.1 4-amino-4-deoxy-L-arabinose transferase-like glycosyltransferase [Chryseobacterium sp.